MDYKYIYNIRKHYVDIWCNQPVEQRLDKGPIYELPDKFCILEFKPTKTRNMWTYATCGMSSHNDKNPVELHIFSPVEHYGLVEILTAAAHYHRTGHRLALDHTINFGRPCWPKSNCEYGLISLPYLDGETLEWLSINENKVQFLWLIPITKQELEYKKQFGISALEDKFEECSLNYLDILRASVI